uniref:zinc finger protein 62 homolog isoform X2 n=1 Tax=Scatophagus argus TaxID=75038 RepID=UPI001ED7E9D4|nr:zinc finger protein 62 homolog isoform X2 [Scatophagus argus]
MPRKKGLRRRCSPCRTVPVDPTEFPADVQQLSKEEDPPEQQDWSSSLDQEEPPEPPHIKEEQEELWTSQQEEQLQGLEETDIIKVSRFQDLKGLFKRRLPTAAREELMGLFETTISGYEKEIERQQKLLDVVLKPEIKLRRADVQQLLVSKEEDPTEQQDWSSSLDQEEPPEPPHIKEEQEELWTSQQEEQLQGLEEADITKFTFTPVKSEEDDEEDPQSSLLHQRQTEQVKTEADGEDCGGPEPARSSDPDRHLQPDIEDNTEDWKDFVRKSFRCSVCAKTFNHKGNLNIHMRTHTGVKPFSCSFCSKGFTQKVGLDYHLKTHTGEKPFSCSLCSKTYRHKGALTYHMATHTGLKPFSCSDCGKKFRGTSQLKIHKCVGESSQCLRSQSDKHKKLLSCSECDATFPNNYLLMTHIRMHKGKKLFTCTVCGAKRQFSSHLEIHMRTHTGEKPYSCSICGKRFSQRGIVKQHMAIHSGVKPFSCSDCGRGFFWQFQIKKHKCPGKSLQPRQSGFNCGGSESIRVFNPFRHLKPNKDTKLSIETDDIVDTDFWKDTRQHQSGFTYRRNKKMSVNNGHNTDKRPLNCSEAKTDKGINFSRQTRQGQSGVKYLKNQEVSESHAGFSTDKNPFSPSEHHLRSEYHHTQEKPFSCLFCEKEFATGGSLTRHVSVHIGGKLLSCVVCEKTFCLRSELLNHQCVGEPSQRHQSQTAANRSFSCSHCAKRFERKHHLQVHLRTHAAEKPFSCSVCKKTFARCESLSLHMTCHTGEKPFTCSVCNTGFIDSESLVKHMRIHTRQTQFSCTVCGKEFAWRRYLTKHMEVHANEKIYRCSACNRGFTQVYQLSYHRCVSESSQLHQSCTEENREAEPQASSSTELMETEADGEDCGAPEASRNSYPNKDLQPDTEDSSKQTDDWENTREPCSGLNLVNCSEHSETFYNSHLLEIRIGNQTKEKPLDLAVCEDHSTDRGSLRKRMEVHTGTHWGAGQEDPEPPHIKEEQDELWVTQKEEQLQELKEADITKFTFTPVPVKSEEDDEEKPQSSLLHQRPTEQVKTEAAGEDCGGAEPTRSSDPDRNLQPDSDDSVDSDFWKETRERPADFNSLTNDEISPSVVGCDSGKVFSCSDDKASEPLEPESDDSTDSDFWKDSRTPQETRRRPYSCSECGRRFFHIHHLKNHMRFHVRQRAPFFCSVCGHQCLYKSLLNIHMRTHTGEKPFICPVCGKKYAHKASMQSHMAVHTVEKQYTCNACDRSFAWYTELKYHQCDGQS